MPDYSLPGGKPYGELNAELLHLKRVAPIPVLGRDILSFRPESSYGNLIRENLWEYCSCIDTVLDSLDPDDPPFQAVATGSKACATLTPPGAPADRSAAACARTHSSRGPAPCPQSRR